MGNIYHPPAGTTRQDVFNRFEQLRSLAYSGHRENFQSGRQGENHFCILDANSREILSVTLDEANRYTVVGEGHTEVHELTMVTQPGAESAEHTEGECGEFRTTHAATTAPRTAEDYEAAWSRAAPPDEVEDRAIVIQRLCECRDRNESSLNLNGLIVSSLPDLLPNFLTEIEICVNPSFSPMPTLPTLPESLAILRIQNVDLTSLPELPPQLDNLLIYATPLTSLPESLANLSSNASVRIDGSYLSERMRRALWDMTSASDYSGPRIQFFMDGPSAPQETRALHLAVAGWLAPAAEGASPPADRWQAFGQEADAASFSRFLDRLSETENAIKASGFKAQISTWLTQLAEDNALREKTFAMTTEATSSCEDRVTLALNQMKNVQLIHNAEKGEYDNNLSGLVSVGREMFRL